MGKRAQRIPSWPGVIHSNKGRIHLRRPTCDILTFRLRRSGGPYIPDCRPPVQKLLDPLCADGEIWAARRMSRAVNVLVWAPGAWIVPTLHCNLQRLTARMQTEAQARAKANAQ